MRHPKVPMARPWMGPEETAAVARVLASGWVMQGPEVDAFEREFAEFVAAPHACAVSSGTAALHLALLAVGVRPGDEVVTVSHSFIATANSVRHCGATPVFVDIEPETCNVDPVQVRGAIGPTTRAILCVHQLGMPCDVAALRRIADEAKVALVEDAACAAGSEVCIGGVWERVGRPHGDVACFSFHPRKLITTGEGGMVTTRNEAIATRIRQWRSHGSREGVYGFNYRMTDVQAAIGRVQLGRLPEIVAERRRLVERIRGRLPSVVFTDEPAWARSNWQSLCARLPSAEAATKAMIMLEADGVSVRGGVSNSHEEPDQRDGLRGPLPHSEAARARCILLPVLPAMTDEEIDRVCAAVERALG
jgi:dTDP-4-amino-4,6-dideoxygalactose transaminase